MRSGALRVTVMTTLDRETADRLEREAQLKGQRISPTVRQIITEHYERQRAQRDANEKRQQ
jgi:hypothetical protein